MSFVVKLWVVITNKIPLRCDWKLKCYYAFKEWPHQIKICSYQETLKFLLSAPFLHVLLPHDYGFLGFQLTLNFVCEVKRSDTQVKKQQNVQYCSAHGTQKCEQNYQYPRFLAKFYLIQSLSSFSTLRLFSYRTKIAVLYSKVTAHYID